MQPDEPAEQYWIGTGARSNAEVDRIAAMAAALPPSTPQRDATPAAPLRSNPEVDRLMALHTKGRRR